MVNKNKELTYISLFSSAGIGCFGFKQNGFKCIATCEILEKRLDIQKINKKCHLDSGYINGDLTKQETIDLIFDEIKKDNKNMNVDVIIATPPCQGMSVANQKKNDELKRNSLVTQAIHLINVIGI
ncbi:MAG: DNA cytosine methyltransferase [Metamycoplasmataceae bacterium]